MSITDKCITYSAKGLTALLAKIIGWFKESDNFFAAGGTFFDDDAIRKCWGIAPRDGKYDVPEIKINWLNKQMDNTKKKIQDNIENCEDKNKYKKGCELIKDCDSLKKDLKDLQEDNIQNFPPPSI